jgi:hypothetical protein
MARLDRFRPGKASRPGAVILSLPIRRTPGRRTSEALDFVWRLVSEAWCLDKG